MIDEMNLEKPSFIITGASGTGKTTLVEEALDLGYEHLPTTTTRERRPGEIDGIHSSFISEEDFRDRFEKGEFLEDDLDFALVSSTGVYYGTPKTWLSQLREDGNVATPVAPVIARKIIGQVATLSWVHLVVNDDERARRLRARGITDAELTARMTTGASRLELPPESIVFDTSELRPSEILRKIIKRGKV